MQDQITELHEHLFKQVIELREKLGHSKEYHYSWFDFECSTMQRTIDRLTCELAGKELAKKLEASQCKQFKSDTYRPLILKVVG